MSGFYTVAGLLLGVVGANILKRFLPMVPEVFILIVTGIGLSFVPILKGTSLEPEFFMLVFIAPLMFIDGQKQSFNTIRSKFRGILLMSVVLAVVTVGAVGVTANGIEGQWTLPLALALAAIVTPTDALAVESLTRDRDMPAGVEDALSLESLFNDATGLVLLDLALSVLTKGTFSLANGIGHFLFVAIGGILIGGLGGLGLVMLRYKLNRMGNNPEIITIPISLLTPFLIYLLAEHFGTSGILAVVATGIEHNWEANRLRLTSTNVQLATKVIWTVITDVLNDGVFLFLGLSLPSIWQDIRQLGWGSTLNLVGLSVFIYGVMFVVRYVWSVTNRDIHRVFWPQQSKSQNRFNARIFAISGVHGSMTLALAFSLPKTLGGQPFPYRNEIIILTTLVILISMLVSAVILPVILPKKVDAYTADEVDHVRNKMVDFAILQMRATIDDHMIRELLTDQLQSQKNSEVTSNRHNLSNNFYLLFDETKSLIDAFIHSATVTANYSSQSINRYDRLVNRLLVEQHRFKFKHRLKHLEKEVIWHTKNGVFTQRQRRSFRDHRLRTDTDYAAKVQNWQATRQDLLRLNQAVIKEADQYLDEVLRARLVQQHSDNNYIYMVQKTIDRFFEGIQHEYQPEMQPIDADYYVRAFQYEYDFIQRGIDQGFITKAVASKLYTEINQAQLLRIQIN
ncbi:sodium:proton antiporter [Lactobacillus sp. CBA3606]|uniref:cation:proton antiporter n=1 Tax=Lactobacillus sp. CBA3606 TaxID=2099789 RepID=UPI000CFC0EEF|nr:sodium:proton antiporter [Lactobacillus sp. CBA3606]AVK62801.1 sodium:proton antiporter [Lactobacillus sp. CBA3606]